MSSGVKRTPNPTALYLLASLSTMAAACGASTTERLDSVDSTRPYEPFGGQERDGETITSSDVGWRGPCPVSDPLTCAVLARARELVPSREFTVLEDRVLISDGQVVSLAALQFVRADLESDVCRVQMDQHILAVRDARRHAGTLATADRLMPMFKPSDWVEEVRRIAPPTIELATPFLDLYLLVYADFGRAARPITTADLAAMGLTIEDARNRALENLRERAPPLPPHRLNPGVVNLHGHGTYTAATLLLDARWRRLAEDHPDGVVVAPSTRDVVLLGVDTADSRERLREAAQHLAARYEHPLTTALWRWTGVGWSLIPDA